MKIANKNAREYISDREIFKGSNLFSEERTINETDALRKTIREIHGEPLKIYVVFSYGYHFPMFACVRGEWYENSDKYSRTTSKQKNQARPYHKCRQLNTEQMKRLVERGEL